MPKKGKENEDAQGKKEKRRGHGEGSVYQREDGRWVGAISYRDPITNKAKRHYIYGKTRAAAIKAKKEWEKEFNRTGIVPAAKVTVKEWLETWLETYVKDRVRQDTFEGEERIVKKHLIPTLGDHLLRDLRPEHIQAMLNQKMIDGNLRTSQGLKPRMVEHIYVILHSAMAQALKNQLFYRNPCDAVTKPKKEKKEFMPWTTQQTNKFLGSVRASRLFPLYMVAWGTGLRRSEILGLQWPDLDLRKGTLTVNRALVRVKRGTKEDAPFKLQEPKTKKSRRTIPLPDPVTEALKTWKAQQAAEKLAFDGPYNELDMVFCDEAGQPINPDFISRQFKEDLAAARLPHIRFHDLRHGHATQLLELGEDLKVVSDRLGHSTITLTADTYSHVRERMQREASKKLGKVLKLGKQ